MKRPNKKLIASTLFILFYLTAVFSQPRNRSITELYQSGVEQQDLEDWYGASQYFMEVVQKNPVYSDAWFRLSQCSYQLGEYDLALSYLDTAEKYAKNDTEILNLRGMIYIALERFNDARGVFEGILQTSPNNVEARFGLAELDLFDGKLTGAEDQYGEALKRQGSNRKALLSLAVVSSELGKYDAAQKYINQALSFYSGETEVHYLSAMVYAMRGDLNSAEKSARIAVEIDGNYDRAYGLLADILYKKGAYGEVIDICDFRIGRDRNLGIAWYLKGCAQNKAGNTDDAINTWSAGLSVVPLDEVMRAALELEVNRTVPLEDTRRAGWAAYHIAAAREYSRRYDVSGTSYEYQRALKIDPYNMEARTAFADMLNQSGFHELYLEQMRFLKENRNASLNAGTEDTAQVKVDDTIEAYDSLLQNTLAVNWNVQPFYLDKIRWRIGIYYEPMPEMQLHAEGNKIAAEFAADTFSGAAAASVTARAVPVSGFGEAYRRARDNGEDYFIMISIDEGSRDLMLDAVMYSGRTGAQASEISLYAAGNNKYSNIFRRFRSSVLEKLPIRGKILDRDGKNLLVDLGKSERIVNGAVFDIVRKGAVVTASSGIGLVYKDSDVLGTLRIDETGEEISQGTFEYKGFYDRVNTDDEVVLVSIPETEQTDSAVADTAPAADAAGIPVPSSETENPPGITAADLGVNRRPSFIELIRSIY